MSSPDKDVMCLIFYREDMCIYGWKLLELCYYTCKSCVHNHCDGEEIMFLICHVTSRKPMF